MNLQRGMSLTISLILAGLMAACSGDTSALVLSLVLPGAHPSATANRTATPSAEPLSSTVTATPLAERLTQIDGCIQPFETFAYSAAPDETKPRPGLIDTVTPLPPWQVETNLVIPIASNRAPWIRSRVMGTREEDGKQEVWIENIYSQKNPSKFYQSFSIYHPDTKKWDYVPVVFNTADRVYYYIAELFFRDGEVWGMVAGHDGFAPTNKTISILSKFDENNHRFVFDLSANEMPAPADPNSQTFILLDSHGSFWFVVEKDSIYRYDPSTGQVENKQEIKNLDLLTVTMTPDNIIYLESHYPQSLHPESSLHRYATRSGEFTQLDSPEEVQFNRSSRLLVDHKGRLWFDSLAWMEPDQTWYLLIPPTIFITNYAEDLRYRWRTPKITTETSDGRLWFEGDNGTTWLDPEKQKWCWFTTEQVVPFEDTKGNLWIAAGGNLYRSSAN